MREHLAGASAVLVQPNARSFDIGKVMHKPTIDIMLIKTSRTRTLEHTVFVFIWCHSCV